MRNVFSALFYYFKTWNKSTQCKSSGFGRGVLIIERYLNAFKIPIYRMIKRCHYKCKNRY